MSLPSLKDQKGTYTFVATGVMFIALHSNITVLFHPMQVLMRGKVLMYQNV